jgi:hypothetical protein
MVFDRDSAVAAARQDLADRLKLNEGDVSVDNVIDKDFPDMSLGLNAPDEMAAQMISTGWQIALSVDGKAYEYRADKYQLRLKNFGGRNHVVK